MTKKTVGKLEASSTLTRGWRALRRRLAVKGDDVPNEEGADPSVWEPLLAADAACWEEAKGLAEKGQRVLVATSLGGHLFASYTESALTAALTLRGARVEVLVCDSFLPACQLSKMALVTPEQLVRTRPQPRCASCQATSRKMYEPFGLPVHWYSQFVDDAQRAEARRVAADLPLGDIGVYEWEGLAVGEHAYAGALRYYARGDLNGEPEGEEILRRYLEASLLTVFAAQGLLRSRPFDVAVFHHGIYVPQGILGEVCRREGVRVVNWNPAYRKHCFVFSHGTTYHHTMISEPADAWRDIAWTPDLEASTLDYLKSRWYGTQDWIWFHEKPQEDLEKIAREVGVDFSKPCVAMLTNVMWDAQLHYKSNAFSNMLEWVLETVRYFGEKRPEVQLVIRVHPAEVRGAIPSRQPLVDEIERAFPVLPPNVFVVGPESQVSTYALVERCNAALIYNTKTGIEVASMKIPVVVAGEAWIRNKGFSLDATNPAEYFDILDRLPLPSRLSDEETERARKYAFHFFFRRMIPMPFVGSVSEWTPSLEITSVKDLLPGRFPGLDVVCDGILQGTPFIYPAERMPLK